MKPGNQSNQGLRTFASAATNTVVRLARNIRLRPIPEGASLILLLILLGSFSVEWISPFDPLVGEPRDRLTGPEWRWDFWNGHIFGTDQLGRDIFVRLMLGARASLQVAAITVGLAGLIGLSIGMASGYFKGAVDATLMRLTDVALGLPIILVALVLATIFRPSLTLVIVALAANLWASYARIVRGETLAVMNRDFIKLARIAGAGPLRIITTHVFPHVLNTFIILLTLQIGVAVLAESSLSFLGAGVPPPRPAWGSMAASGRSYIEDAWWVSVFPGLAILSVVLCFNLVGDWLRDKLDPSLQ